MIRMLHIVGSMSPSGIGNFIMNIYRNIDREKVQFDFIVHEHRQVSFDDEISLLGGRLFYVTRKSVNPVKNFIEIMKVVRNGKYQLVFRHTDTATVAMDLVAAKLGGAKRRIPHSHSTSTSNITMHRLFQPLLNFISTDNFACSEQAGQWLFGKKKYEVILNGIDVKKFSYDAEIRKELRKKKGFSGEIILGHVGNLLPVKNHLFLVEILAEAVKWQENATLMLVGGGIMEKEIKEKAKELGVLNKIYFAGVQNNIPPFLQIMDIFCFPSFYEGMPIALVEAQASGLPCLVSETVTNDVIVTDLVQKLPIQEEKSNLAEAWAVKALQMAEDIVREEQTERIENSGFSIRGLILKYEGLAEELRENILK